MFREAGRRSKRQLSPSVALDHDHFVAFPRIVPIATVRVRAALDHADWIFEPKLGGFRALAYIATRRRLTDTLSNGVRQSAALAQTACSATANLVAHPHTEME